MSTNLPANTSPPEQLGTFDLNSTAGPWFRDGDGGLPSSGFSWRRYLRAVARYKWLLLGLTILGAAAGFQVSRTMKPTYGVEATLWVQTPPRGVQAQDGPFRASQLLGTTGWLELLKSYVVVDHVVREHKLFLTNDGPAAQGLFDSFELGLDTKPGSYRLEVDQAGDSYTLASGAGEILERGKTGDSIGSELGFVWQPAPDVLLPGRITSFAIRNPRDVSRGIAGGLSVRLDREGNFLHVSMHGPNPQRTANILNAILDRYTDVAADLSRAKSAELTEILQVQLEVAERSLRQAETELEDYRVQTITLPSELASPLSPGLESTQAPVLDYYFDLKVEEEQLRRDRAALERVLTLARDSALSVQTLSVIPSIESSSELDKALDDLPTKRAELRDLLFRYTDQHPSVKRLAEEVKYLEEVTIPRLVTTLMAQLDARLAMYGEMIQSASAELRQIPPRAIEEARLQRKVETAEKLASTLRERFEEARLAEASTIADVHILDRAVASQRPSYKAPPIAVIVVAGAAGFGLGLLGIGLFDRTDPRLRYPEQVSDDMGLTILGTVPHLKANGAGYSRQVMAQANEAFRSLRMNIEFACRQSGQVVLTIGSPGEGDGKSFITSNLALAFASLGIDTLVIDGDLRRGTLHRLFEARRKPGIADYLAGKAARNEVIQNTQHESLHFVASGTRLKNAPELLQSSAMSSFLDPLRSRYGVILIDTPPLAAGIDSLILAAKTTNLLLVLRTGETNRDLTEAKLKIVDRLPIRLLGAVLNDTPSWGAYRYYGYLGGYEAIDEIDEIDDKTKFAAIPG